MAASLGYTVGGNACCGILFASADAPDIDSQPWRRGFGAGEALCGGSCTFWRRNAAELM